MRRKLKWLGWSTVVLLAVAGGGVATVVWTEAGSRFALEQALPGISDGIPGAITIESMDGSLASGLEPKGLRITGPDETEALRVDSARLGVGLMDLLERRVYLPTAEFLGVDFTLYGPDGRMPIVDAFVERDAPPTEDSGPAWRVDLPSLTIGDGTFVLRAGQAPLLQEIAVTLGFQIADGLSWSPLSIQAQPGPELNIPGPLSVASDGGIRDGALTLERLEASAGPHRTKLTGWLNFELQTLDLALAELVIDLPDIAARYGLPRLLGEASADGRVTGSLTAPRAHLDIKTAAGEIHLRGGLDLTSTPPGGEITITSERLDPAKVAPDSVPAVAARLQATASSRGDLLVDGSGAAKVTVDQIEGVDFPIEDVHLNAVVEDGALDATLRVDGQDAEQWTIRGTAESLLAKAAEVSFEVAAVDLKRWTAALGVTPITGLITSLTGQASPRWDGEDPAFSVAGHAALVARTLAVPGPDNTNMAWAQSVELRAIASWAGGLLPTGELRLRADGVEAGPARLDRAVVRARAAGVGGPASVLAKLERVVVDGEDGSPLVTIDSGTVETDAAVLDLRAHQLEGDLRAGLSGLTVPGARIGSVVAELWAAWPLLTGMPLLTHGVITARDTVFAGGSVARADADVDITVGLLGPLGRVAIDATDVRVGGFHLQKARAELQQVIPSESRLVASAHMGGTRVELGVDVEAPDGFSEPFAINVHRLEALHRSVGISALPGAKIRVSPSGDFAVERLALRRTGIDRAEVRASLDWAASGAVRARAELDRVDLASWSQTLRRLFPRRVSAVAVGGTLTSDLRLTGTVSNPAITATMSLDGGQLAGLRNVKATLDASSKAGRGAVALDAEWRGASVQLEGSLPLHVRLDGPSRLGRGALGGQLQVKGLDLGNLTDLSPALEGIDGVVRIEAKLTGNKRRPGLELTASADGLVADGLAKQNVTLVVDATRPQQSRIRLTAGPLRADLTTHSDPLAVLVQGRDVLNAVRSKPLEGVVSLTATPLEKLLVSETLGALGTATAEANIELSGTPSALVLEGTAALLNLDVAGIRGDASLTLSQFEGHPKADITVFAVRDQLATAELRLPAPINVFQPPTLAELLVSKATELSLQSALPMDALDRLVPGLGEQLLPVVGEAVLKTTAKARGGAKGASVRVEALLLGEKNRDGEPPLVSLVDARLVSEPASTWLELDMSQPGVDGAVEVRLLTEVGTTAALAGAVPDIDDLVVRGSIKTNGLKLDLLSALTESIETSRGTLDVYATLGGKVSEPVLAGDIRAHFDELVVPSLGWVRKDLDLAMEVKPGSISLQPLRLEEGDGVLLAELNAKVERYSLPGIKLDGFVNVRRFPALQREDLAATVSGHVTFGGTAAEPRVTGRITADSIVIKPATGSRELQPIGPPPDVVFVDRRGQRDARARARKSKGKKRQRSTKLGVDVVISIPDRALRITNDSVDVWAQGELRVDYAANGLELAGRIEIDEGSVTLYGREFVLQQDSSVLFDGKAADPALSIEAKFSLEDLTLPDSAAVVDKPYILLRITGRASKPDVVFTSHPALSQTDILALVTVGFAIGETTSADTEATSRVPAILLGALGSQAARMLKDRLAVDVVQLSTGSGDLSDMKLRLGKRFLRNLTVSYYGNYGADDDENTHEVGLVYDITPRIQLDSRFGDAGAGSLDVLFHWRW